MTESNGIWTVPLPSSAPYGFVRLRRRHSDELGYRVVLVDPNRLIKFHQRDQFRLPDPSNWPEDKRKGLQQFLDPADPGAAEMPLVSVWDAQKPGWWARLCKQRWPAVSFTNGRHRAYMLHYFGAPVIPVEVSLHSLVRFTEIVVI